MTMNPVAFEVLYKKQTVSGSNYFKLLVTLDTGEQVEARYFGNTMPKDVISLHQRENGDIIAKIQRHTSRDKNTGRFTNFKRKDM